MNVYLDGMFYRCSGVGRVYENLLSAMVEDGSFDRIRTAVPHAMRETFLGQFGRHSAVRPLFLPYGPMSARDLFLKGGALVEIARDVPLFYFPSHNVPVSVPGRYVMTVNDLTVFSDRDEYPWHRRAMFRFLLSRTLAKADRIVTISRATADSLSGQFRIPRERIEVLYPWIEGKFFRPGKPPAAGAEGRDGEYILFVGLRIARKNLEGLIRAFLMLAGDFPEIKLVIAGGRYREPDAVDRLKTDPRLAGRLIEVLDPPDEEVLRLLSGARAFVFPSFDEGFGLPPLEAMASGVPVVCSDIPVFREVYGDAAVFADPRRPESIADGIRRVLADRDLAGRLIEKGRAQAALYGKEARVAAHLEWLKAGCAA